VTDYEVPPYPVFFFQVLIPPFDIQIFSLDPSPSSVEFVVHKVTLKHISLRAVPLSLTVSFHLYAIFLFPSSTDETIDSVFK